MSARNVKRGREEARVTRVGLAGAEEIFERFRSEVSDTVARISEMIASTLPPIMEPISSLITDALNRVVSPVIGNISATMPTIMPIIITSIMDSLRHAPTVSYAVCTSFIPDICTAQCVGMESCYDECRKRIENLCAIGAESVRMFIEDQLKRFSRALQEIAKPSMLLASDVLRIETATEVHIVKR